jgi:hypothetical protein
MLSARRPLGGCFQTALRLRVRVALRTVVRRTAARRVRAPFLAAALRCAAVRRRAEVRAWRERLPRDAAVRPSRESTPRIARERFVDGFRVARD